MGDVIMFPPLGARRGEDAGECAMESFELAALYARRAEETRMQAKLMVNDSVRSAMERVADIWEALAQQTLVRHALDVATAEAEKPTDKLMAKS